MVRQSFGLILALFLLLLLLVACSSSSEGDPDPDGDTSDGDNPTDDDDDDDDDDDTLDGDTEEDGDEPNPLVPRDPPAFANPLMDEPYLQEFNHTSNEVEAGLENLVSVLLPPADFTTFDEPTQITPRGVVRHTTEGNVEVLSILEAEADLVAAATNADTIFLVSGTTVYTVNAEGTVQSLAALPDACQTPGLSNGSAQAYLFCESGLYLLSADALTPVDFINQAVTAVTESLNGLYIAGEGFVSLYDPSDSTTQATWSLGTNDNLPDAPVVAVLENLSLPEALDLVVVTTTQTVGVRLRDGQASVLTDIEAFQSDRIPLMPVRGATKTGDGGFILYTAEGGACRIMERGHGPEWRVYNWERWLPNENVRAVVTPADSDTAPIWFATAGGLATVTAQRMTLQEKMALFDERLELRHDRDGAVADSRLSVKGDLSTSVPYDSDNDGGWTCYQVLAQCYQYRTTGDERAKQRFDKALDAMLNLHDLTGTDYFLGRSVIRKEGCQLDDCDNPDDGEWFTSPDGEWWVKADTSNDEVTSHMFMMGPAYDLCADDEQKERIRRHVGDIIGGIVENNYQLVDLDGEVTTYGQLGPDYVNDSIQGQFGDGGRRSAQMIANLNLAYYLTGEQRFADAKADLLDNHHYAENILGEADYPFRAGHGSNDGNELVTQAYMILLRYEQDNELYETWKDAWANSYSYMRPQQASLWDVANAILDGPEPDMAMTRRWQRLAPVDMIRWTVHNGHRQDLAEPTEYYQDLGFIRTDGFILPYDERPCDRFNQSQLNYDGGNNGMKEMDGAEALSTYWMARYYQLIVPAE